MVKSAGDTLLKPAAPPTPSNLKVRTRPESVNPGAAAAAEEIGWVERARAGDAAAFRRLVERYRDRAYGLALRVIGSAPEAEEAAQDAFVRAWRALAGFRGEAAFSTWIHRIVIRCALDASASLRARRARETGLDAAASVPMASVASRNPDGSGRLARRLEGLLASLSEAERSVVALYYYEDRSVAEVARTLDMPAGTVKTHLHRARAALRRGWMREEAGRGER